MLSDVSPASPIFETCPSWPNQKFFLQHLLVEQHRSKDALSILDDLHPSFPGSSYVLAQTAVAHYHLRSEYC